MHKGWLVVNGYITNPKFLEIYQWLLDAGKRQGCEIIRKTNIELMELFCKEPEEKTRILKEQEKPEFVIFWDKDVRLAKLMEESGIRLFNSAEGIAVCDDKSMTYIRLKQAGIRMPKTWIAPKTFAADGYDHLEFFENAAAELGYPLIVKECFGSFGRQVYLAKDWEELVSILQELKNRPFILQEYIESSCGRDIRIQIVGGEMTACMYRYNDADFRANITNGGKMKPYQPEQAQKAMAQEVCRCLNLDFAGVDILFGENDEPVLCEVNSNAHFKNIYDCTGVNVADAIISHVLRSI